MSTNKKIFFNPWVWLAAALTLGLMPYTPEPHIWEKLKWISAGASGMRLIDWFDFILHGTPWLLLVFTIVYKFLQR